MTKPPLEHAEREISKKKKGHAQQKLCFATGNDTNQWKILANHSLFAGCINFYSGIPIISCQFLSKKTVRFPDHWCSPKVNANSGCEKAMEQMEDSRAKSKSEGTKKWLSLHSNLESCMSFRVNSASSVAIRNDLAHRKLNSCNVSSSGYILY